MECALWVNKVVNWYFLIEICDHVRFYFSNSHFRFFLVLVGNFSYALWKGARFGIIFDDFRLGSWDDRFGFWDSRLGFWWDIILDFHGWRRTKGDVFVLLVCNSFWNFYIFIDFFLDLKIRALVLSASYRLILLEWHLPLFRILSSIGIDYNLLRPIILFPDLHFFFKRTWFLNFIQTFAFFFLHHYGFPCGCKRLDRNASFQFL